ncbi:MAG: hypothetical protein V1820_03355 [archaeon]
MKGAREKMTNPEKSFFGRIKEGVSNAFSDLDAGYALRAAARAGLEESMLGYFRAQEGNERLPLPFEIKEGLSNPVYAGADLDDPCIYFHELTARFLVPNGAQIESEPERGINVRELEGIRFAELQVTYFKPGLFLRAEAKHRLKENLAYLADRVLE